MFQPKSRRAASVLALTASLFFLPPASASAATSREPVLTGLVARIEAQILSLWDAFRGSTTDVGPRMDDNG